MDSKEYEYVCNKTWFKLIVDGSFMFYKKNEILQHYLKLLSQEGFDTYIFDCSKWESHKFLKMIIFERSNQSLKLIRWIGYDFRA